MTYMIFPYSSASAGAKDIAAALDGYRIKRQNSTYKFSDGDVVINWGASDNPFPQALNADVKSIISKKEFFDRCKYASVAPKFALTAQSAKILGCKLVCREQDKGKDGSGIKIWDGEGEIPWAKLYVELVPKTHEYRVHIARDKNKFLTILGQQRKFFSGDGPVWVGDDCKFVWTVDGNPVVLPAKVKEVCLKTMDIFPEIDFTGLDVVYDSATNSAYVLEANSAPTMTPKTVEIYAKYFEQFGS